MVGNKVACITHNDYSAMYSLGDGTPVLRVGGDLLGNQEVNIPISRVFGSHIGIFGNSGSGKSNTLHRLYFNLFKKYGKGALENSKFIVIDFNGEYSHDDSFGVSFEKKSVFKLSARSGNLNRIPLSETYLSDAEILSMLFGARSENQVSFINSTLNHYNKKRGDWGRLAKSILRTYKKILTTQLTAHSEAYSEWVDLYKEFVEKNGPSWNFYSSFFSMVSSQGAGSYYYNGNPGFHADYPKGFDSERMICDGLDLSEFVNHELEKSLLPVLEQALKNSPPLSRLGFILRFSYIYNTAWGDVQKEYLDPLMKRIGVALKDLDKVVSVGEQSLQNFNNLNIVDLSSANQNTKRMIPALVAKIMYAEQKDKKGNGSTTHLIIDEAHNILNANSGELENRGKDYCLDAFEEIVKEGRKFGFYVTLSSQRPADILPSIVYQIHNFFIHRLVNELDLQIVGRTTSTLDHASFEAIPSLGKGECVITGADFSFPVLALIDWNELEPRPHSNDLVLTDLWVEEPNPDSNPSMEDLL